jgi:hypothetical protein
MKTENYQAHFKWQAIESKKHQRRSLVLVVLVAEILFAFYFSFLLPPPVLSTTVSYSFSIQDYLLLQPDSFLVDSTAARPLYPYSVVPGGVYSSSELRSALRRDPIVATHYANIHSAVIRIVRLTRDRNVYVSYRLDNRIYWTHKKITLHSGESVLTDGEHFVRTRCGNRISDIPVEPVSPIEPVTPLTSGPVFPPAIPASPEALPPPDPAWLDSPANPVFIAQNLFPHPSPSLPGGGFFPPPPIFCCAGPTPHTPVIPPSQPPPFSTSEPQSLVFLAFGVAAVAVCSFFISRKHPS